MRNSLRRPARAIWWAVLRARFYLSGRRRYRRLVLETVSGRPFLILPAVFNPKLFWSGEFLVRNLRAEMFPDDCSVLDLGTGSGVGAVTAAAWTRHVVAVDCNPSAVRCARINSILNQYEDRIDVRLGDLFEPVAGEIFDRILFNPPYFLGVPADHLEAALKSPDIAERFACGLDSHLAPGGCALLVLSSAGEESAFLGSLAANGFDTAPVCANDLFSETLRLYRICRLSNPA